MSHPFQPKHMRHHLSLRVERDGEIFAGNAFSDGFDVSVALDTPDGPVWADSGHFLYAGRYPQFRRVHPSGIWTERAVILAEQLLLKATRRARKLDGDGLPEDRIPIQKMAAGTCGVLTSHESGLVFRSDDGPAEGPLKAYRTSIILLQNLMLTPERAAESVAIAAGTLAVIHPPIGDLPPFLTLVQDGEALAFAIPPRLVVELADADLWLWAAGSETYFDDSPESYRQ